MPELPFEIWKERIENEIKNLKDMKAVNENLIVWHDNNVELWISLQALGFIAKSYIKEINVEPRLNHRVFIKINRSFPYPGGIDFSWHSNIFHPNIHPVELTINRLGTGYICLNVLRQWSRLFDLETTVKALEKLVENPNPNDPLQYEICLEAAEFFKKNPIEKLRRDFRKDIEEKEKSLSDEDDIIIIKD